MSGNTDTVRWLLMQGADPDPSKNGKNLCIAAQRGVLENVELLIDFGARVNVFDEGGFSPLFAAVLFGQREAAMYLVQRGADVQFVRRKIQRCKDKDSIYRDADIGKVQATLEWAIEAQ